MNIEKKLDALKNIRQVDAPDFLLTRIEARLSQAPVAVSRRWKLATIAGFVVMIILNTLVVATAAKPAAANIETVVNAMNLNTQNNLYDE